VAGWSCWEMPFTPSHRFVHMQLSSHLVDGSCIENVVLALEDADSLDPTPSLALFVSDGWTWVRA
jgi:hypothetical protein